MNNRPVLFYHDQIFINETIPENAGQLAFLNCTNISIEDYQLNDGGRLIIPEGSRYSQALCRCVKRGKACITEEDTMCVFVPLIGEHGWEDN